MSGILPNKRIKRRAKGKFFNSKIWSMKKALEKETECGRDVDAEDGLNKVRDREIIQPGRL